MRRLLGCLIGALVLGAPATAAAAVRIGAEQIEVRAKNARAVIDRVPFRVAYQDGAGNTVLRQAPNAGPAPKVVSELDPEPFGFDHFTRQSLYSPLTFTVGGSRTVQPCPGNVCGGNQGFGIDGGVEYAAKDVIDAKPLGDGVQLTLSTNDPTGRRLVVEIAPGPGRSMRTKAVPVPAAGVSIMADSFSAKPDEAFRGFGGRHNKIDQRGEAFYNWPEQENSSNSGAAAFSGRDDAPEDYQFANGPHAAYYVQALFYSSEPFGFLLNQTDLSFFRMAYDREDAWSVSAVADRLDYVVAPGTAKQAIRTITGISGRHRVPPEWALGAMSSHFRPFAKADNIQAQRDVDLETIRRDLEMIKKHDIELESYDLFSWALHDPAEVQKLIKEFHALGIKVLSYFPAFADDNTHGFSEPGMFAEAIAGGYYVKTAAGTPYVIASPLVAGNAVMIDFTNPAAVEWWQKRVKRNLDLGFDGFMEDFGEQISLDMYFYNGQTGATMHNAYPNYYHAATRKAFEEWEAENPGRKVFNYTRSGFSGTTDLKGSAWGEIANFPGDNSADWTQGSGLRSSSVDMLSRAVGGAWGYTTDIGGYLGETPKELFYRWTQWAALSPYFRLHNSSSSQTRQPWFYDEGPTVALWNRYAKLHKRAIPLIMRLAKKAAKTGIPPTRPMWLQFPNDAEAAKQAQQWMLGENVLVAPVVHEGATKKKVYFPAGCWKHGDTKREYAGPGYVDVSAGLNDLPWFERCGTDPIPEA